MKVPRFVKEYANYQLETDKRNDLMRSEIKQLASDNCDKAIRYLEQGLITVDEAVKLIMNCRSR